MDAFVLCFCYFRLGILWVYILPTIMGDEVGWGQHYVVTLEAVFPSALVLPEAR